MNTRWYKAVTSDVKTQTKLKNNYTWIRNVQTRSSLQYQFLLPHLFFHNVCTIQILSRNLKSQPCQGTFKNDEAKSACGWSNDVDETRKWGRKERIWKQTGKKLEEQEIGKFKKKTYYNKQLERINTLLLDQIQLKVPSKN